MLKAVQKRHDMAKTKERPTFYSMAVAFMSDYLLPERFKARERRVEQVLSDARISTTEVNDLRASVNRDAALRSAWITTEAGKDVGVSAKLK